MAYIPKAYIPYVPRTHTHAYAPPAVPPQTSPELPSSLAAQLGLPPQAQAGDIRVQSSGTYVYNGRAWQCYSGHGTGIAGTAGVRGTSVIGHSGGGDWESVGPLTAITTARVAVKKAVSDCCPKCGERGAFVRMALTCSAHGAFGGC